MYTFDQSYGLVEPTAKTRIEQHGDSALIRKDWCPELRKLQSNVCTTYTPTEVRISHTNAGHLTPDVVMVPSGIPAPDVKITCRYLIIRDFGVGWRHIKEPTKSEPLLLFWLTQFETDSSLLFRIVGYSDCVAKPATNSFLRTGRANNVRNLLGVSARSRVISVGGAPLGTYLTDNSTVQGRANNRSVVIEFFVAPPTMI